MYWDYSNIQSEWDAEYKGYYFEMAVQEILDRNGIDYLGNPKRFQQWKQYTIKGYDIRVNGKKVECKFALVPIYHSWFLRDWCSRNCDIIVTNNKFTLGNDDRLILKAKGVKLMDVMEFISWILENLDGNKYNLNISSPMSSSPISSDPNSDLFLSITPEVETYREELSKPPKQHFKTSCNIEYSDLSPIAHRLVYSSVQLVSISNDPGMAFFFPHSR
jgi:hypothetical protein